MPNTHATLTSLFEDIADSIRNKTGENRVLIADNFPAEIDAIQTGGAAAIAVIDVTSNAGATVTLSKSGETYTATEIDGHWHFFVPETGTYTITATLDGETKTDSITVTNAQVYYEVEVIIAAQVANTTYLYYLGDECEDVTGGWETHGFAVRSFFNLMSGTKNTNNIQLRVTARAQLAYYKTQAVFNMAQYTLVAGKFVNNVNRAAASRMEGYKASSASTTVYLDENRDWILRDPIPTGIIATPISSNSTDTIVLLLAATDTSSNENLYMYCAALAKADDISGLAEYGSTISAIISNASTLLADQSAVNYMIYNCTGDFMWTALSTSSFLTALDNSPYKTQIQANAKWAKALALTV